MRFERRAKGKFRAVDDKGNTILSIQKPKPGQSLGDLNPDLALEWNQSKNGILTPFDVMTGCNARVWWKCSRGHEWETTVLNRAVGHRNCPYCFTSATSYGEQFIYWSFKELFKSNNQVYNRKLLDGYEYDIVVIPLRLCIEYSGEIWHTDRKERDLAKQNHCKKHGVDFIEIIETQKKQQVEIVGNKIVYSYSTNQRRDLEQIVKQICSLYGISIDDINFDLIDRQALSYSKGLIEHTKTVDYLYPNIAAEWDTEANNGLTPSDVTPGSPKAVGWICPAGHKYTARISNRCRGSTCPICANRKIVIGVNDLATTHPHMASQWNTEKNGNLKPTDVTSGSCNEVWWKSEDGYEWKQQVRYLAKRKEYRLNPA